MAVKKAVIDIGTNSVRLLMAEVNSKQVKCLKHMLKTTRLGEGMRANRGRLRQDSMKRTLRAVNYFHHLVKKAGIEEVAILGTSALREAVNREEFLAMAGSAPGLEIKVLSSADEAYYSFRGAVNSLSLHREVVFMDVGGGSTEVAWEIEGSLKHKSFPVGAVNLKEAYLVSDPPTGEELYRAEAYLTKIWGKHHPPWSKATLLGTGGTVTSLASIKKKIRRYHPGAIHGERIKGGEIKDILDELLSMPLEKRKNIPGLPTDRADIIIPGAVIVGAFMKVSRQKEMVVSEGDMLAGYLSDGRDILF